MPVARHHPKISARGNFWGHGRASAPASVPQPPRLAACSAKTKPHSPTIS